MGRLLTAPQPGGIVLLGSGETAPSVQKVYHRVFADLDDRPQVAILETPAGFEPNSEAVAGDIALYLEQHLQNYHPQATTIPARRSDGELSTNNPELLAPLYTADVILTGPGSPTYAVRHLRDSLCWDLMRICQRLGCTLFLSSAATVAIGLVTLPVYEIYKVGMDLHWQPGLDLFGDWGLALTVIPHWNNRSGGEGLDTRRCYVGTERFRRLLDLLPPERGMRILGIDENTAVRVLPTTGQCEVLGNGAATILYGDAEACYEAGQVFSLDELGDWSLPAVHEGIDSGRWRAIWARLEEVARERQTDSALPPEVQTWLQARQAARAVRDWVQADRLRDLIQARGWEVRDTPHGQEVSPLDPS